MTHRTRRRNFLKGIGAAGVVGLAGCTGGNDDNGDDGGDGGDSGGQTINLGLLMGVTGGLEELGPPIRDAAALVPDQVNEADVDVEVETRFEDTATDATEGTSGAEALLNAGYQMFVGALSSDVSLSVAQSVAIPNEMVMCSPASTAPEYTDLDGDFTFRTAVPDAFQGEVLAEIAAERLGHDSAATLVQDDSYGRGLGETFADSFEEEYGGTVTDEVVFARGESSYTTQLQTALSGDPDTLLIVGYPEDGVTLFRDFYSDFDRGDMDVLVADGLQDSDLPSNVGYDMTNVTGTAPIGEGPGLETFQNLYSETYDVAAEGQPFIRQSYDAAAVLTLAKAAAGENDGPAIRDQVREVTAGDGETVTAENLPEGVEMAAQGDAVTYEGVSGQIVFDENGDRSNVAYEYYEFTGDGLDVVDTISL